MHHPRCALTAPALRPEATPLTCSPCGYTPSGTAVLIGRLKLRGQSGQPQTTAASAQTKQARMTN
ncbi:hypothetical protein HaLaN_20528 [Haematococcus lacustris]|uniref:Uncharacterized protein n=1 Tax=Haematococcus lacustris TaxID=44745 RepID=A0A699ZWD1_HAELA|nr:hypothetical protein HaLaN_20528 [Haematococcus lacustris]